MNLDLFSKKDVSKEEKANNLERIISYLDKMHESGPCLHPDTGKTVSDFEYEEYRKELSLIRPKSKVLLNTILETDELSQYAKKVKHNPPMTSISKINGTEKEKNELLKKWISDCLKNNTQDVSKLISMSFKVDGVACALYYENGTLVKAGLRPRDGVNGEDITENIKYVKNVPIQLTEKITCSIRGELDCRISVFNKLNGTDIVEGKVFANPRNYTAGSIRQFKDPEKTKNRQLEFVAYTIENLDNAPYKTEIEKAKYCSKLGFKYVYLNEFSYNKLKEMENEAGQLDYMVDGIVLTINNVENQEQLGRHGNSSSGNPKGKVAWKFKDEIATVEVKNIRWQIGRTGKLTPVLEFNGVNLEGTTVSQCTAHNVGIVKKYNIDIGSKIEIIKSGKIIPKFLRVVSQPSSVSVIKNIINQCPSCNSDLIVRDGDTGSDLFCINSHCPAQNTGRFVHYLSTIGVKGLAESTIEKLIDTGLVTKISDLYKLDFDSLIEAGLTERTALLIVARIHMMLEPEQMENNDIIRKINCDCYPFVENGIKSKIPIELFIAALGIDGASKGTALALTSHFGGNIDYIMSASVDDLEKIGDVGNKTALSVYNFFKDNASDIYELLEYVDLELPKSGSLSGKTFVFTGGFDEGKSKWEKLVIANGGKISNSVSKKVDCVVIGEDPGSKAQKAHDLKNSGSSIEILTQEDLEKIFQ